MTVTKPFSQACENNKVPVLAILKKAFGECRRVLEIGSGTGQHAVYFSPRLPHLHWHTSDRSENHAAINFWINDHPAPNLHRPRLLDVNMLIWPLLSVDGVYTANTCHIMSQKSVNRMFAGLARHLEPGGVFCLYGPFKYQGNYTSESNAKFDLWLKRQDPRQGIRNFEDIAKLAHDAGLELINDHEMPANNRLLEWRKRS